MHFFRFFLQQYENLIVFILLLIVKNEQFMYHFRTNFENKINTKQFKLLINCILTIMAQIMIIE